MTGKVTVVEGGNCLTETFEVCAVKEKRTREGVVG